VTGASTGSGSAEDYATEALNTSTGAVVWVRRYNGPGNGDDQPAAITISPDSSRVYVTGQSAGKVATGIDYTTIAYSATGTQLWAQRYNGPGHGTDTASDLVATADGTRVIVTGTSKGSTTGQDWETIAYRVSTGAMRWGKRYSLDNFSSLDDHAVAVVASPDSSTVFVTGAGFGPTTGDLTQLIALNASTGDKLWIREFGGPSNQPEWEAFSPDGSDVYVSFADENDSVARTAAITTAFNSLVWEVPNLQSACTCGGLAASPDRQALWLAETVHDGSLGLSYYTLKFNTANGSTGSGGEFWSWGHGGTSEAYGLAIAPDSSTAYVTGQTQRNATSDFDYTTIP
jgi:hypothetical protein